MSDPTAAKQQAENYRKQKQFDAAIVLYQELWNNPDSEADKWVGWGLAHCLRKIHAASQALEICRSVYKLDPDFDYNNQEYAWCIYELEIKPFKEDIDEEALLKAANAIIKLSDQKEFSPYEYVVFFVVKHYEKYKDKQKPIPHAKIMDWLDKLNIEQLSKIAHQGLDGKSYPSPKEDWYTSRTKALLGLGRYAEVIEFCTQALSEFPELHNAYDVWFRQYRSESYMELGETDKALADIEYMMKAKPDPWIRHRYALALYATGEVDAAIRYACEAAIPFQRLGFRWEVYLDLGNMLDDTGEKDLAVQHILLAAAIRHEEGWEKIPENLQNALERHDLSLESLPKAKNLHRELENFWKSMKPRPKTSHQGSITELHPNGKSGRIKGNDGTKYFFGMRSYKAEQEANIGMKVNFNLEENVNRNTGAKEFHAVDIFTNE